MVRSRNQIRRKYLELGRFALAAEWKNRKERFALAADWENRRGAHFRIFREMVFKSNYAFEV